MGILESMNFDNLPEEKALPDGEYEVTILDAEEYVGKESGKTSIRVVLGVMNEPDAQDIFTYLALPQESDTQKTANSKMRRIRDFLTAFDLTKSTPYVEWKGHKSWALLKLGTDNRGEPRNDVQRFLGNSDNSNIQRDNDTFSSSDDPFGTF